MNLVQQFWIGVPCERLVSCRLDSTITILCFCSYDITKIQFEWMQTSGLMDLNGSVPPKSPVFGGHRFMVQVDAAGKAVQYYSTLTDDWVEYYLGESNALRSCLFVTYLYMREARSRFPCSFVLARACELLAKVSENGTGDAFLESKVISCPNLSVPGGEQQNLAAMNDHAPRERMIMRAQRSSA